MIRILGPAALAAVLCSCANTMLDPNSDLERRADVRMTVIDRKSYTKRFWVTLRDPETGVRYEQYRFSGKWCSRGTQSLHPGQTVTVTVDIWRDRRTGQRTRKLNSSDLDRRFC